MRTKTLLCIGAALAAGCVGDARPPAEDPMEGGGVQTPSGGDGIPTMKASNAFYYYEDVEGAWAFYTHVLGFETAADFGFAKIMRVAPASYLTLVDVSRGMHGADEPKSVTLAVVTEQVEDWYAYLVEQGVPMRAELNVGPDQPHDGFVAIDPEGYLLEFERFNDHPENVGLSPLLDRIDALGPVSGDGTSRPAHLEVQATVLWLYFDDVPAAQRFYETALGLTMVVDQGWAKIYPTASTGFLGLVDGARGLHQATDSKAVTVSFFVDRVEDWLAHLQTVPGFEFRTGQIGDESGRVRTLVGYDVEGYFLEWDTFLDVAGNEGLVAQLNQ